MKRIYTLSVVDDGNVTGEPGRVLVASRELILDENVFSSHDMMQGHAALCSKISDLPPDWDHTPFGVREGGTFQKGVCANEPTNIVKREDAIWIWERTL